jgi:hypothetical protein
MQQSESWRWQFVVDEISGKTGRVIGDVPSRHDRTRRVLLVEFAEGSKATLLPERVQNANREEIWRFVRDTEPHARQFDMSNLDLLRGELASVL